jgi:hypothetical protein
MSVQPAAPTRHSLGRAAGRINSDNGALLLILALVGLAMGALFAIGA